MLLELFCDHGVIVLRQVDGVSEFVRRAFSLLLDLYGMDCEQFCDTEKPLYSTLLKRIIELPWEARAKYQRLCALLPYLGTDLVRDGHHVGRAAMTIALTVVRFFYISGAGSLRRHARPSPQVPVDQSPFAMRDGALQASDPAAAARAPRWAAVRFAHRARSGQSVVASLAQLPSRGPDIQRDPSTEQQLHTLIALHYSGLPLCRGSLAGLSGPACPRPPLRLGLHHELLSSHDWMLSLGPAGQLNPRNPPVGARVCRRQSPPRRPQPPLLQPQDQRCSRNRGDVTNESFSDSEPKL